MLIPVYLESHNVQHDAILWTTVGQVTSPSFETKKKTFSF